MSTQTIDELYNLEIRERPRQERQRLVELAVRDLDSEAATQAESYPGQRTHELFEQWRKEDEAMTPEEIEADRLLWEQFKTNINAERDRAGARRVY